MYRSLNSGAHHALGADPFVYPFLWRLRGVDARDRRSGFGIAFLWGPLGVLGAFLAPPPRLAYDLWARHEHIVSGRHRIEAVYASVCWGRPPCPSPSAQSVSETCRPPPERHRSSCVHIFEQNSASAWRATMAPRQLLLELNEVDMAADKGAKRIRVDRADTSSMQVRLPASATACFTSWPHALRTAGSD